MVAPETGRVALFSIHPQYAEAILDGQKTVEFRRTVLPADVTHVVVYATSPVKRIVGVFEVAGVECKSPRAAWVEFGAVGGIERRDFYRYYDGTSTAYIIKVKNPQRLKSPIELGALDPDLRPPQSFQYLTPAMLNRYRNHVPSGGQGRVTRQLRVPSLSLGRRRSTSPG